MRKRTIGAQLPPGPLERIPAGTVSVGRTESRFLERHPVRQRKACRGRCSAVSESMNYYGELFNLVYMANAKAVPGQGYILDRVAVTSTKINGEDIVVTADTANKLGANLSFIGRAFFLETKTP